MNIPAMLMGTAVFVFFKYGKWNFIEKHEKAVKFVRNLSAASFGVYLIHYYIKDFQSGILKLTQEILYIELLEHLLYMG